MTLQALRQCASPAGRTAILRYVLLAMTANLAWEVVQLPLYAIWQSATTGELVYAVVHCTIGDFIILAVTFLLALLLAGDPAWPKRRYGRVGALATLLGVIYTVFSEWVNVAVLRSWTYAPAMPLLPPLGTGLLPVLQWLVIPPSALFGAWLATRQALHR